MNVGRMDLNSKIIRKSLFQDSKDKRLVWRLHQVFWIKAFSVKFTGNFVGEAEVLLVEPLLRKSRVLAISGDGVTEWQAKDAFEEIHVFGPASIELSYSGRGDCKAFLELEVEAKSPEEA